MTINWKWQVAFVAFMLYVVIARYCAFKLSLGLAACGCN